MPELSMHPSSLRKTTVRCSKRLLVASTLAAAFLHAGCTPLGAAQQIPGSAGMVNFLSAQQLDSKIASKNADFIFSQLMLSRALGQNDSKTILDCAEKLLGLAKTKKGLDVSAPLMDASLWMLSHDLGDTAWELVEKASVLQPEDLPLTALRADLLMQAGRGQEALELLQGFLKRHPDDAKAQAELALALFRDGQAQEAMTVFTAIPEDKLTPQIRFAFAQSLNAERRFADAEKQLRLAVKADENFSEAWQLLALTLEDLKRDSEARDIYKRQLDNDPNNRSARIFLLRHYLLHNDLEKAAKVIEDSNDTLQYAVAAFTVLVEDKQSDKAEKLLRRLEKDPNMPGAIYFYHAALLYESEASAERILPLLDRVPENSQEYDKAMRMKVQLLFSLKRFSETLETVEIVCRLNPEDVEPLLLKAELLVRLKKFAEAEQAMLKILEKDPDNESTLFQHANLQEYLGRHDEAMRLMENVIERFPDNALALNFVGYNLADSGKDLERALALVQKATELRPDTDFIIDSLAWVCYRLGRYEEAWTHIQRACHLSREQGSEDPTMLEHYGDIALTQKERKSARAAYEAALELFLKHNLKNDAERIRNKLKKL